ncbi:MAG: hypothetical protein IPG93_21335 [Burkholderiales bacterium]|nr:hypothetical protein [Burkholderiales bacterium]
MGFGISTHRDDHNMRKVADIGGWQRGGICCPIRIQGVSSKPYPKLIVALARLSEADFQVRVNAIIAALPNHARVPEPWPAPVPGLTQVRHVAVDKLPPSPTWARLRAARPGGMRWPWTSPISVIVA